MTVAMKPIYLDIASVSAAVSLSPAVIHKLVRQEEFPRPGDASAGSREKWKNGQKLERRPSSSRRLTAGPAGGRRRLMRPGSSLQLLVELRQPVPALGVIRVPVIDAADARQHVSKNRLTDLIRTSERSQYRARRSTQIVRCPMRHRKTRPLLFRSRHAIGHVAMNGLTEHFLLHVPAPLCRKQPPLSIAFEASPHNRIRAPDQRHPKIRSFLMPGALGFDLGNRPPQAVPLLGNFGSLHRADLGTTRPGPKVKRQSILNVAAEIWQPGDQCAHFRISKKALCRAHWLPLDPPAVAAQPPAHDLPPPVRC